MYPCKNGLGIPKLGMFLSRLIEASSLSPQKPCNIHLAILRKSDLFGMVSENVTLSKVNRDLQLGDQEVTA